MNYIIRSQAEKELYHHGVLGMRWGVRRYQNKDGTLTPAGKKKYLNQDHYKKTAKEISDHYAKELDFESEQYEFALKEQHVDIKDDLLSPNERGYKYYAGNPADSYIRAQMDSNLWSSFYNDLDAGLIKEGKDFTIEIWKKSKWRKNPIDFDITNYEKKFNKNDDYQKILNNSLKKSNETWDQDYKRYKKKYPDEHYD